MIRAASTTYVFRLYVSGAAPSSVAAIRNLRALCADLLPEQCEIEVVDIVQRPDRLAADNIVATPTLVRASPPPLRHVVGDLSDRAQALAGLDIGLAEVPGPAPRPAERGPPPDHPYRALVETLRQGVLLLDRGGRVLYCNPWCAARLGLTAESLLGVQIQEYVDPADHATFGALLEAGVHAAVDAEVRMRGAGRLPVPVRLAMTPYPEADTVRVCLLISDLTEERRVQAARRLLQEVAMDLSRAENVTVGLRHLLCRVCRFGGWIAGEAWLRDGARMRRRSVWAGSPSGEALVLADAGGEVRRGEGLAGEAWARGAEVWTDDVLRSPRLRRGRDARRAGVGAVLAVPVAARDEIVATMLFFLTERRDDDDALLPTVLAAVSQTGPLLQRRVAEEGLAASLREKDLLLRDLDDISHALAHDLRTPIRTITSFSQLVLEQCDANLGGSARGQLEAVVAAAKRMSRLINDAARLIEVPRALPARRKIDVRKIAQEVVWRLKARDPERDVVVKVDRSLRAHSDPNLARLVLEELLANAWSFTAGRSPATIRVGVMDAGGEHVFFVRDNGVGFDMSAAGKLFDPFTRLSSATHGTGMGLAVVRRAIARLGGRVWYESAPDAGTTFYFTLGPPEAPLAARE
ncbi:MAG: circadian clock KaiB family protein [Pseudomonadota bacterium]|nr:circadian clock KaiB family protein [Pseudomonadota bacterium]